MIREFLHKIGFHWWIETGKWTRKCRLCHREEVFIAGIGAADWVEDRREEKHA